MIELKNAEGRFDLRGSEYVKIKGSYHSGMYSCLSEEGYILTFPELLMVKPIPIRKKEKVSNLPNGTDFFLEMYYDNRTILCRLHGPGKGEYFECFDEKGGKFTVHPDMEVFRV